MKNLILIKLLILSLHLQAQSFSIRTTLEHHQFNGMGLVLLDSHIIIQGFSQKQLGSLLSKPLYGAFDFSGNYEKMKIIDFESNKFISPFDRAIERINNTNRYISVNNDISLEQHGMILIMDENLNIYDSLSVYHNIGPDDKNFFMKVYLINEIIYVQSFYRHWNSNNIDFRIYKFDRQGNQLDMKQFGQPGVWNRANSMIPSLHNTFIVGSSKQKQQTTPGSDWSYTWIVEVDSNLNLLKEFTDPNDSTYEAAALLPLSDGSIIYSAVKKTTDLGFGYINYKPFIARLNSNWTEKVWETDITQGSWDALYRMRRSSDGHVVAVGRVIDKDLNTNYFNSGGLVTKFSIDGEIIWQREYYPINDTIENESILWDFDFLPNGDIMAGGWSLNFNGNAPLLEQFCGWLLRLDEHGCLEPGCHLLSQTQELTDENLISVYPNPGITQLNIQANGQCYDNRYTVMITDMHGRLMKAAFPLKPHGIYQINTLQWTSGMYLIHLLKDGKRVNTKKWIRG